MKSLKLFYFLLLYTGAFAQSSNPDFAGIGSFKNSWSRPPIHIPNNVSIDAPLMGNGDVTMSVGYKENVLRYYLSKNDFWRLKSQSDNLSGPRVVGFLDFTIEGLNDANFTAEQMIKNGITTCLLNKNGQKLEAIS